MQHDASEARFETSSSASKATSLRRSLGAVSLVAAAGLLGGSSAMAQGFDADPEFFSPRFSHNGIPGVQAPDVDEAGTVRWGGIFQYQRNPVTAYQLGQEVGAIVPNRMVAHLGVSWDITSWATARVVLPTALHWGTGVPGFASTGAGLGDASIGAAFRFLNTRGFKMGAQADVMLPTRRPRSFMGERDVRGNIGLMAMGSVIAGDHVWLDLIGDVTFAARRVVRTNQDYDIGPELLLMQGARLSLPWIPVKFTQALVGRSGLTNPLQGGAENGLELMGGLQIPVEQVGFNTNMTIDVMAGRGTNQGFGTTDFRMLAGVTFARNPGRKPKPVAVASISRPPPPPPPIEEEEVEPEGPVYKQKDEIVIRDPIEFLVDTAKILPHSEAVVQAVADLVNNDPRIKHLVIEAHASAEGSFSYNYELSTSRAQEVFRQLIIRGVSPERISYKAYGEVRPKVEGDDEAAYAVNRRVEFHIVSEFGEFDDLPTYEPVILLPWNGEQSRVVQPPTLEELERMKMESRRARTQPDEAPPSFEVGDDEFEFTPESTPPARSTPDAPPLDVDGFDAMPDDEDDFGLEGAEPSGQNDGPGAEPEAPEPGDGSGADPAESDADSGEEAE